MDKLQLKLSSESSNDYITVTTHFIVNAELHSTALQTSEVHNNQTKPKIASKLRETFTKWTIDRKIVSGANVKSAINYNLRKHHHSSVILI